MIGSLDEWRFQVNGRQSKGSKIYRLGPGIA